MNNYVEIELVATCFSGEKRAFWFESRGNIRAHRAYEGLCRDGLQQHFSLPNKHGKRIWICAKKLKRNERAPRGVVTTTHRVLRQFNRNEISNALDRLNSKLNDRIGWWVEVER